jgi:hypothetical protein
MKKINILEKITLTKEDVLCLVEKFPYKKDMAEYLGINLYQLNLLMEAHNISYPKIPSRKGKIGVKEYTFITKDWLIENWAKTNKSLQSLSTEFSVPLSLLETRASRWGLSKKYKYQVNKDKIFDLTDPNVWYLAGLVATDGYLPFNRNAIEFTMVGESEKKLLSDILSYFECTSPLMEYSKGRYSIRLACDGLNRFLLENFGIPCGAKTFNVETPKSITNEDCAKAYVRGCIDGDGCIRKNKVSVTILTASEKFILGVKSIIKDFSGIDTHFNYERGYPLIRIGGAEARNLLRWVYSVDNCLMLERKYQAYLDSN